MFMLIYIFLAQYTEKLEREQNAPSLEEERQELRQSSFNIAKKRVAIIKEVQVGCSGLMWRLN